MRVQAALGACLLAAAALTGETPGPVLVMPGLPEKTLAPESLLGAGRTDARQEDTVVFSIGELLLHKPDPRVFLLAETAQGPLTADQGPVRLIAVGQRARSAFGLARIELRYLGDNPPMPAPKP